MVIKELNGVKLSKSEENMYKTSYELIDSIEKKGNVIVHQLGNTAKEVRKYYRLLENERLEEDKLIETLKAGISEKVKGRHVLQIQDTSDIDYWNNRHRIDNAEGLGQTSNTKGLGYFLHPSLLVDANSAAILGLSDIYISNRPYNRTYDKSTRKLRKIEEKESYKWLLGLIRSKDSLSTALHTTVVADRESDLYEFLHLKNNNTEMC